MFLLAYCSKVWHKHFSYLSTPKANPKYDEHHFRDTNQWLEDKAKLEDIDTFLEREFTPKKISEAISKLHVGKAPGFDYITTEHLKWAADILVTLLSILYNTCIQNEYVLICLRRGLQVPLYKGKMHIV